MLKISIKMVKMAERKRKTDSGKSKKKVRREAIL